MADGLAALKKVLEAPGQTAETLETARRASRSTHNRKASVRVVHTLTRACSIFRTMTDQSGLQQECRRMSIAGYATDFFEAEKRIHCAAASNFDRQEPLAAMVRVTKPLRRVPKCSFVAYDSQDIGCAQDIARRLPS